MIEQRRHNEGFLRARELDYDGWRESIRIHCGQYTLNGIQPRLFAGKVVARNLCGFRAVDVSSNAARMESYNATRVERTKRDAARDGREHYYVVFQLAGRSTLFQHGEAVELATDAVALVDTAQPIIYVSEERSNHWRSLQLPRRSLVSHLGWEPRCVCCRRDRTVGARLLLQLLLDGVEDDGANLDLANPYLRLTFYDLIGAVFAPDDPVPVSLHADRLFARICSIIKDRYTDPAFGPRDAAAEARISLRYLQKLFTVRNLTCGDFIHTVRLDHAARLLQRRMVLSTGQSIGDIAYASGFGDYGFFLRKFRRRFGRPPGAHNVGPLPGDL
jgi:AraC-like DNA-binding protein